MIFRRRVQGIAAGVVLSSKPKHRGVIWAEAGVLAVANYAENAKKTAETAKTFHTIS
ncbi:MAG: hypothetical protein FWH27_14015 [Planctomycetaceae bacterium]|nr:hypothetical protein [Planctomycetaceae bacterium]